MSRMPTAELVNKVFAFCEAYSGVKFFPYQAQFAKRIIRSVLTRDGDTITALFARQCLHKDSLVLMSDYSKKPISEIRKGDSVLGFDYNRLRPCEVTEAYSAGVQEGFKLTLRNGKTILSTANHRFLDKYSRLFKPLYSFEAGDEIGYTEDFDGRARFSRIKSIEPIGDIPVYDIEVLGAETFCADDFIVHNSGKSETVATVAGGISILLPTLAEMPMFASDDRINRFAEGVLIGIFAPALHQAQIAFNRMKLRMGSKHSVAIMSDPDINVTYDTNNGQNITLSNGSITTCMSASEGSNIEGKSYMIIIIDEAQDISNFKYLKSIRPMGAFYNATNILIGTPTTSKGFFFDIIESNKREYQNGDIKIKNHFEYDYNVVMRYNPAYEDHIKGEKKLLGEDSDEFMMSYGLKWILERGMFVKPATFEKLGNRLMDTFLMDMKRKHVAGIDFGKKSDSTVVTILEVDYDNPVIVEKAKDMDTQDYIAYNTVIKAWLELTGDDYEEQYPQIISFLSNFNIVRMCADCNGAGSPIVDRLSANLPYEVIPFAFSSTGKSALYKHFSAEITSGRFTYPASDDVKETREYQRFTQQMLDLQKSYSGQNLVVSHPPVKGAHDDYPDSAALAVFASKGEEVGAPVQEKNEFYAKTGHKSKSYYGARNRLTARR